MNQAALIFHEAIYKYARDQTSAENSDSSRKVVATFMAKEPVKSLADGIPESAGYCSALLPVKAKPGFLDRNFTQFYILKNASGGYHVQFISFLGAQLYSKTSLDFPAPIKHVPTGRGKVDGSWLPLPGMQLNLNNVIPHLDQNGNFYFTPVEDFRYVISTDTDENWRNEVELHFVSSVPSDAVFAPVFCNNFSFPDAK